jgi:hypothetical protein
MHAHSHTQDRITLLSKPPRRWKVPKFDRTVAPRRTIEGGSEGQSVEHRAIEWYASHQGGSWNGVHTENGVWLMLFGCLFADIIFGPCDSETESGRPQASASCTSHTHTSRKNGHGQTQCGDAGRDPMAALFPTRCMDAPIDWETPLFGRSRYVLTRLSFFLLLARMPHHTQNDLVHSICSHMHAGTHLPITST